jgi:hypothetical protein
MVFGKPHQSKQQRRLFMNENPNGAFPNYVEEQTETRQQYIDRIFGQWLEWAEGAGSRGLVKLP